MLRRRSRTFYVVVNPEIEESRAPEPQPVGLDDYPNPVELPASPQSVFENTGGDRPRDARLNPKYNFDNFVIGSPTGSHMPQRSRSPRRRRRPTTRSSSTATRASARPTSCTRSATTR